MSCRVTDQCASYTRTQSTSNSAGPSAVPEGTAHLAGSTGPVWSNSSETGSGAPQPYRSAACYWPEPWLLL